MQFGKEFMNSEVAQSQIKGKSFLYEALYSVDTRTLQPGDVFVALKGERVDGHDFIAQAIQKGASGFIIAKEYEVKMQEKHGKSFLDKCLVVKDPCTALVDLAKSWRRQFSYPVVAITGSVGKTTTKEYVAQIFRYVKKDFIASFGNQNTLIGVAMNVLKMRAHHKFAVFETGIGLRGSMEQIVDMIRPTLGVITCVGHAHMEGLGSLQDVAAEKRKVFSFFAPENIGIINGDQEILSKISYMHPIVRFGCKTTNQIQARKIVIKDNVTSFVAKVYNKKYPVVIKGTHEGRVMNVLAAIAVGQMLQIDTQDIIDAVQKEVVVQGRFEERVTQSGAMLINDCYNANPESMKASLLAFNAYETTQKKVIVLGDMLELGIDSPFWHRQVGRFLRKVSNLDRVILVGSMVQWVKKAAPLHVTVHMYATWQEALSEVQECVEDKSTILFKASNGVGLTNIVDTFSRV